MTAKPTTSGKTKKATATKATAKPRAAKSNPTLEELAPVEQEAFLLSEAAILLDNARGKGKRELAQALEHNLEIWTAIQTKVARWTDQAQEEMKANLIRLGDFVTGTIMSVGTGIADTTVETIININLQIAEGLLEGYNRQRIRDRAYYLWIEEGRQEGRGDEYWRRAEQEIMGYH